jgi:hypothetical protein
MVNHNPTPKNHRIITLEERPDTPLHVAIERHQQLQRYLFGGGCDVDEINHLTDLLTRSFTKLGQHIFALTMHELSSTAEPQPLADVALPEAGHEATLHHEAPQHPKAIITETLLSDLQDHLREPEQWRRDDQQQSDAQRYYKKLHEQLATLLQAAPSTLDEAIEQLTTLIILIDEHHLWKLLSSSQREPLCLAAIALARHAHLTHAPAPRKEELNKQTQRVFSAIGRLKHATTDAYFYGMAKAHEPAHGTSWLDDARHHLGLPLDDTRRHEALAPKTRPAPTRQDEEQAEQPNPLPDAAGQRWIILGGNPCSDTVARLERLFNLKSCEWIQIDKKANKRAESVAQRLQRGTVDVVILIGKFCRHATSDKLRKASKHQGAARYIELETGYGLNAIIEALQGGRSE